MCVCVCIYVSVYVIFNQTQSKLDWTRTVQTQSYIQGCNQRVPATGNCISKYKMPSSHIQQLPLGEVPTKVFADMSVAWDFVSLLGNHTLMIDMMIDTPVHFEMFSLWIMKSSLE